MEQISYHRTDFREIWRIFRKYVKKIKVLFQSDKQNGYFAWIPTYIYDIISLSVCLSVRMEQLSYHWMDFREIWRIFRKYVKKIKVLFQSDKHNGYFAWIPTYIYDIIFLSMSVRPHGAAQLPPDGFSWNLKDFSKICKEFKVLFKFLTSRTGTLHEYQHTFMILSLSVLLRMRNVWDEYCWKNQNTPFMFSNFFSPENRTVFEIMWKNIVQPDRIQIKIWCMRIAC